MKMLSTVLFAAAALTGLGSVAGAAPIGTGDGPVVPTRPAACSGTSLSESKKISFDSSQISDSLSFSNWKMGVEIGPTLTGDCNKLEIAAVADLTTKAFGILTLKPASIHLTATTTKESQNKLAIDILAFGHTLHTYPIAQSSQPLHLDNPNLGYVMPANEISGNWTKTVQLPSLVGGGRVELKITYGAAASIGTGMFGNVASSGVDAFAMIAGNLDGSITASARYINSVTIDIPGVGPTTADIDTMLSATGSIDVFRGWASASAALAPVSGTQWRATANAGYAVSDLLNGGVSLALPGIKNPACGSSFCPGGKYLLDPKTYKVWSLDGVQDKDDSVSADHTFTKQF